MIGILTSSLGGFYKVDGRRIPTAFSEQNGLADQLRTRWKENAKVLFFPASPETPERNDAIRDCLKMSFALAECIRVGPVRCQKQEAGRRMRGL